MAVVRRREAVTQANARLKPMPRCPDCGAEMVLLKPRPSHFPGCHRPDNFLPFLGCIDYPKCDGSRQISPGGASDYAVEQDAAE